MVWRFPRAMLSVSSAPLGGGIGPAPLGASTPRCPTPTAASTRRAPDRAGRRLRPRRPGGRDAHGGGRRRASSAPPRAGRRADAHGRAHPSDLGRRRRTSRHRRTGTDDGAGARCRARSTSSVRLPARLLPAALVNALVTATEAKTQALWDLGIAATGTASDALCASSARADGRRAAFGGPRLAVGCPPGPGRPPCRAGRRRVALLGHGAGRRDHARARRGPLGQVGGGRAHGTASCPPVTYVATLRVGDDADLVARVERHRARRPAAWRTVQLGAPDFPAGDLPARCGGWRRRCSSTPSDRG